MATHCGNFRISLSVYVGRFVQEITRFHKALMLLKQYFKSVERGGFLSEFETVRYLMGGNCWGDVRPQSQRKVFGADRIDLGWTGMVTALPDPFLTLALFLPVCWLGVAERKGCDQMCGRHSGAALRKNGIVVFWCILCVVWLTTELTD